MSYGGFSSYNNMDQQSQQRLMQRARLIRTVQSAANWFFAIAALSLINTVLGFTSVNVSFVVGLGITQIIDGFTAAMGGSMAMVGLVADLVAIGAFALFGVMARNRQQWAFVSGLILYALDAVVVLGLILLITGSGDTSGIRSVLIGLAFHAYALFRIFQGMRANQDLAKLEAASAGYTGGPLPPLGEPPAPPTGPTYIARY